MGPGQFGPDPDGMMFAHIVASGLFSLLWLVVLGAAIWGATRLLADRQPTAAIAEPSALELLRRRYVQGEIDVTTFEEMLECLVATETPERTRHMLLAARQAASGSSPLAVGRRDEGARWTTKVTEVTEDAGDGEEEAG